MLLRQLELFPFTLTICQAMAAVAISTILFLGSVGKERLVLFGVDFVLGVTAHTERINLR